MFHAYEARQDKDNSPQRSLRRAPILTSAQSVSFRKKPCLHQNERILDPYAVYGHFYDATQRKPDGARYLRLLQRSHPRARTLLEIACGTGAHLAALAGHYEVTGLDISRTMLRYARRRLPEVRFHRQDMAGFKLKERFDAVICPYDSINHMLRLQDWVRTFKAVKQHLNPRGVFIFDTHTEYNLRRLARAPTWVHPFGGNLLILKVSISSTGVSDWDIRVFEHMKRGAYRLRREVIQERSFAHRKIVRALRSCFDEVHTYDRQGLARPKANSERLFYVCRFKGP